MPNWCEGVIKIRGNKQQIINYLKDLLRPIDFWGNCLKVDVEANEFEVCLSAIEEYEYKDRLHEIVKEKNIDPTFFNWYLEKTRRAFIECDKSITFYFWGGEDDTEVITIESFKQAWGVIPSQYLELSKKHQVDLYIFGFEKGMEFTQEIEIHSGKIVKHKEREYDDYQWEVPFSDLGG
ncbi:TPA: hypothetical protein ACGWKD_000483 [Streptococcus agalactiae]|nr:hypothetical protein [Streptococcus agalactiae]OCL81407.1 hypothetical protein AX255_00765 [Streptococcus agalactiae]OCM86335.1 hypothetical protein AX251_02715 [Streptococcus agalactiae]OCM94378.1 hypothetical protein AX252_08810 [Streptococcus agalactiae]HEN5820843.1 hypothetical protein [Streptococcus agalactiae]HEN5827489.1 hypothetical protein [Streptococcus agalactiae]